MLLQLCTFQMPPDSEQQVAQAETRGGLLVELVAPRRQAETQMRGKEVLSCRGTL